MPGEASRFVIVLERIARRSLAQVKDSYDADLNRPLELPESNTAFALATHLIGSAECWVLRNCLVMRRAERNETEPLR